MRFLSYARYQYLVEVIFTCLVDLWEETEEDRSGIWRESLLHVFHKLLQVSGVRWIGNGCHSSLSLCSCAHRCRQVRGGILAPAEVEVQVMFVQ